MNLLQKYFKEGMLDKVFLKLLFKQLQYVTILTASIHNIKSITDVSGFQATVIKNSVEKKN